MASDIPADVMALAEALLSEPTHAPRDTLPDGWVGNDESQRREVWPFRIRATRHGPDAYGWAVLVRMLGVSTRLVGASDRGEPFPATAADARTAAEAALLAIARDVVAELDPTTALRDAPLSGPTDPAPASVRDLRYVP